MFENIEWKQSFDCMKQYFVVGQEKKQLFAVWENVHIYEEDWHHRAVIDIHWLNCWNNSVKDHGIKLSISWFCEKQTLSTKSYIWKEQGFGCFQRRNVTTHTATNSEIYKDDFIAWMLDRRVGVCVLSISVTASMTLKKSLQS